MSRSAAHGVSKQQWRQMPGRRCSTCAPCMSLPAARIRILAPRMADSHEWPVRVASVGHASQCLLHSFRPLNHLPKSLWTTGQGRQRGPVKNFIVRVGHACHHIQHINAETTAQARTSCLPQTMQLSGCPRLAEALLSWLPGNHKCG